jgi:hypothetical protein
MHNRLNHRERAHLARVCSIEGCGRMHLARGYCQNHYMQLRRAKSQLVAPVQRETPQEYIKNRVELADHDCWEWRLSRYKGYGKTGVNGRGRQAHIVSYEAFVGPVPEGMQINHKCHNRACCNPEHLYAGTQKQNMKDMLLAGRGSRLCGETNGNSKLTATDVCLIRASKDSAMQLRQQLGVSEALIRAIRKGLVWRHL